MALCRVLVKVCHSGVNGFLSVVRITLGKKARLRKLVVVSILVPDLPFVSKALVRVIKEVRVLLRFRLLLEH